MTYRELFHRTDHTTCDTIVGHGFRDPHDQRGVWFGETDAYSYGGHGGDWVVVIEIDPVAAERFRYVDVASGDPLDMFVIPADVANACPRRKYHSPQANE